MLVIASGMAAAQENASNPLAAVNSTDVRLQYMDLLAGIGTDRPYDWGVGVGVRFNY
jgi:hypothetical protein